MRRGPRWGSVTAAVWTLGLWAQTVAPAVDGRARFTPAAIGREQGWLNGRTLVDFHGATANAENAETGHGEPGVFYFKMGLYRNVMREPMTVYIDEYRKRELRADEF